MTELIGRKAVEAQGALFQLASFQNVLIADAGTFESRIMDITDPISNPAAPLPDFGDAANISFVRNWVLAWSIRLNLIDVVPPGWAGTNRSLLLATVFDFTAGLALTNFTENVYRLWIPAVTGRFVYTGSREIHSRQARLNIRNLTGDQVLLDIDVWAKSW